MNPSPVLVLVVIVNYRTPGLVIECLHSLQTEVANNPGLKVTVVENASGDDSAEKIAAAIAANPGWAEWITLAHSSLNGGFSYGNNFAVRPALALQNPPQFVWLLNPDTVVHPGTVGKLLDFMAQHPKVGICGGGLDDVDGTPWPFAFRFPSLLGEFESSLQAGPVTRLLSKWVVPRQMGDQPDRADWICGANMMIRREVFDAIGLMDEEYFLYFEETDFCLQAYRAGFECWYLPQGRVIHISGQSTGVTGKINVPRRLPGYWFDSRRRYYVKNHGRLYAMVTDALSLLAFLLRHVRLSLQRKPDSHPPHYLRDFFHHAAFRRFNIKGGAIHRITKG